MLRFTNHIGRKFIGLIACVGVIGNVSAETQTWNLSDAALKACVEKLAAKQRWHSIADVTEIRCHSQGIKSLRGLESFKALQKLSLHNNDISEIELSAWPLLTSLTISENKLQAVTIDGLANLQDVFLFRNRIQTLQLINLPQLKRIKANGNGMTSFTYQGLGALEKIYLFDNQLEHMDIYNLPALDYMDVRQNPMPDELYEEMDRLNGVTILHDGNEEDWQ